MGDGVGRAPGMEAAKRRSESCLKPTEGRSGMKSNQDTHERARNRPLLLFAPVTEVVEPIDPLWRIAQTPELRGCLSRITLAARKSV